MSHHHHSNQTTNQNIPVQPSSDEAALLNDNLNDQAEKLSDEETMSDESLEAISPEVESDEEEEMRDDAEETDEDLVDETSDEQGDGAPQTKDDLSGGKKEVDWRDAYVRLAADFDNYRKRTSKEQDDIRRRECERVVGLWLEVYDNAERALSSMKEQEGPWYEGFASLIQQMDKCLSTLHIKVVDDVGQKFDPKRHEAIATIANPVMENNTIMYVERKGFVYENGDIARVARVVVVKNPS